MIWIPIVCENIDEFTEIDGIRENGNNAPTLEIQFQGEILKVSLRKAPFCHSSITERCGCFILKEDEDTSEWEMGTFIDCDGKIYGEFKNSTDYFGIAPSKESNSQKHLVTKFGQPKNYTEPLSFENVSQTEEGHGKNFHYFKPLAEFEPLKDYETGYVHCFFVVTQEVIDHLGELEEDVDFFLQTLTYNANFYYAQFNILLIYRGRALALPQHSTREGAALFNEGGFKQYDKEILYHSVILLSLQGEYSPYHVRECR